MPRSSVKPQSRITTFVTGISAAFLVLFLILFPDQVFQASLQGLTIWWKIVFPALLPFLVLSQILSAYGMIQMLGVLLDPLLRFLFKIPGAGGWALAMGLVSGFPAGAEAAGQLRCDKLITRCEGERLLSVSHLCNPVVAISVIAVGFFHNFELGWIIYTIHLLSALFVGLFMRLHRECEAMPPARPPVMGTQTGLSGAFAAMHRARQTDGRSFGKVLGDAVTRSIETLMSIGGFMIIFSVAVKVCMLAKANTAIGQMLGLLFKPFGWDAEANPLIAPISSGILEVHLGTYALSQTAVPLVWQAAFVSALLGWGGVSVHLQVKSITRNSDIRYTPFFLSRIVHAAVSIALTFTLWHPLSRLFGSSSEPGLALLQPVISHPFPSEASSSFQYTITHFTQMSILLILLLAALLLLSAGLHLQQKLFRMLFTAAKFEK